MTQTPEGPERGRENFWRVVLAALESNSKTARLVVILLAIGLVMAVGAHVIALP